MEPTAQLPDQINPSYKPQNQVINHNPQQVQPTTYPASPTPNPIPVNSFQQQAYSAVSNAPLESSIPANNPKSKSILVAFLLNVFGGMLGADRFYLGKIKTGLAKFALSGGLYIFHGLFSNVDKLDLAYIFYQSTGLIYLWVFIDTFLMVNNKTRTKKDEQLTGYDKNKRAMTIIIVIFAAGLTANLINNLPTIKLAISFFFAH